MTTGIMERAAATPVRQVENTWSERHYRPNVDIVEQANELTVFADMPGASADSVDVHFENGTLTLVGKVRPRQNENIRFLAQEYGVGSFYRTFEVSESIDATRISAEFTNGVLTLHLPKVEAVKPRKIKVTAS